MAAPPPPRPPSPATKKFIALCVNTGEFNKTLGEIEVSSICTDRQMFHKFKETYQTLRGFRAGAIRWFLIRPVDIQFIQVCSDYKFGTQISVLMVPSLPLKTLIG